MGMLNASPTTVLPASTGYEVLVLEGAGEVSRWPIIAWAVIPAYGYGLGGSIQPICLAIAFSPDVHGIILPDGRVISAAESTAPRIFKSVEAWTSAMTETIAARTWYEAGVPTAGKA